MVPTATKPTHTRATCCPFDISSLAKASLKVACWPLFQSSGGLLRRIRLNRISPLAKRTHARSAPSERMRCIPDVQQVHQEDPMPFGSVGTVHSRSPWDGGGVPRTNPVVSVWVSSARRGRLVRRPLPRGSFTCTMCHDSLLHGWCMTSEWCDADLSQDPSVPNL